MGLRPTDFESAASAISPPRRAPGLYEAAVALRTMLPMRRLERKLFAITDEIALLQETLRQVDAELDVLEHLQDDAVRDAAVGGPIEREDARETTRDVERFRRLVDDLRIRIARLDADRTELLDRLAASSSDL